MKGRILIKDDFLRGVGGGGMLSTTDGRSPTTQDHVFLWKDWGSVDLQKESRKVLFKNLSMKQWIKNIYLRLLFCATTDFKTNRVVVTGVFCEHNLRHS
ncbi:hypothetical protein CEXT_317381 [Caerostris extrusa]|uniref:Uncharacterized protein n=1 Tax=Caerostris extrusa TaxID=172846 RepID=A0AAV4PJX0_CAEEX|nr:hypothetical protein CEXT_317381 [Caerostris extrusa]